MSIAAQSPVRSETPAPNACDDVRPILARNESNLWTAAESLRDQLYESLKIACETARIEPLLLRSAPLIFPVAVRLECWVPEGEQSLTRRSKAAVRMDPKPFHRHPLEVTIEYERWGRRQTARRILPPNKEQMDQLVRFLLGRGAKPRFTPFRNFSFQVWRPKNKIDAFRPNFEALVFLVVLLGGMGLVTTGATPFVLIGFLGIMGGMAGLIWLSLRPPCVRNEGKPYGEPRQLVRVDSWQTVVFDLGSDAEAIRSELRDSIQAVSDMKLKMAVERVWYWGLEGKEERDQFVLSYGRGILFVQVYQYDKDLYVGWDGHLNEGQWVEIIVAQGIDKRTGRTTRVTRASPGTQANSEYDLMDLSLLIEWTHARLVKILKRVMEERQIDQEIDFKIQRSERSRLTLKDDGQARLKGRSDRAPMFRRTG